MKKIFLVITLIAGLVSCRLDNGQQSTVNSHNHDHSATCNHDHEGHNHDHNHDHSTHNHDHQHSESCNHDHNHEAETHNHNHEANSQQPTAMLTTTAKALSTSQSTNKRRSTLKLLK